MRVAHLGDRLESGDHALAGAGKHWHRGNRPPGTIGTHGAGCDTRTGGITMNFGRLRRRAANQTDGLAFLAQKSLGQNFTSFSDYWYGLPSPENNRFKLELPFCGASTNDNFLPIRHSSGAVVDRAPIIDRRELEKRKAKEAAAFGSIRSDGLEPPPKLMVWAILGA
ncbi:hypothetical protein FSB78_01560 [Sphingomonas ginsenosidivorax]|uniref:Uncharacterized protein n=1 Tax=Sphingomonas ginsenosidivorax TaxID=862135 RepID=A0A5C6UCV6_9SPHN|nr:hypothetical protein [Sphingomonas ginsenosidivorax]TXC69788.1 hypothetical protein FSB78_01560 [Sphingomonas ginsenosidivorax]